MGGDILLRSSQQLPQVGLGPLMGISSRHGALHGPSTQPYVYLPELQRYKNPVRCVGLLSLIVKIQRKLNC